MSDLLRWLTKKEQITCFFERIAHLLIFLQKRAICSKTDKRIPSPVPVYSYELSEWGQLQTGVTVQVFMSCLLRLHENTSARSLQGDQGAWGGGGRGVSQGRGGGAFLYDICTRFLF